MLKLQDNQVSKQVGFDTLLSEELSDDVTESMIGLRSKRRRRIWWRKITAENENLPDAATASLNGVHKFNMCSL